MTDITVYKKQRSVNKGKLTFIINSLKKSADISIDECKAKLIRVERLMEEFTSIENSIFTLDTDEEPDMEYEQNYYRAITELNQLIRKRGLDMGHANASMEQTLNVTQTGADIRLPKLNVPVFSGDYREWQSFYDMYASSIHDSVSLSHVQKFQYLKSLLRGEAASLLRHFTVTEANYIEALQKLRQRYDRKRHTINSFIRSFIEQPSITQATSTNIMKLLDTSDEVLRGLKAMGPNGEDRDPWIIYIINSKLDDETKSLWAQATAEKDHPTIQNLLDFLIRRGDALESFRNTSKRSHMIKPLLTKTHVAVSYSKCTSCQAEDHSIYQCPNFNSMDEQERRATAKSNRLCFNCLSKNHSVFRCLSKRRCVVCHGKHHSLLHLPTSTEGKSHESTAQALAKTAESKSSLIKKVVLHANQDKVSHSVLPTVTTTIITSVGHSVRCRALLDSGSQANFITESCFQRLHLPRQNGRIVVKGLGQVDAGTTKGKAIIQIQPLTGPVLTLKVFIVQKITTLPRIQINPSILDEWKTITLADPDRHQTSDIDLLIGIDHFFNIIRDGQIKISPNEPILQNTIFGWVIAGSTNFQPNTDDEDLLLGLTSIINDDNNIDRTLRQFWELESIPNEEQLLTPEEELSETNFKQNTKRNADGRFQVRLPFKKSTMELGNSLPIAIQRFKGLERRFLRDKEFFKTYSTFIQEYLSLGHMHEIKRDTVNDDGYFLPHHGVIKMDSTTTKLRVVFDGSAKTSSGVSLNDCLAVGATVQSTLFSIVLRFREHRIIFSADIEKMYRQIRLHDDDTKFQRIVWRDDPSQPFKYYELNTVTYGLASAPFLATRTLQQIAEEIKGGNPIVATTLKKNVYVDDVMTGGDNFDDVQQLKRSLNIILSSYGFKLRKWVSNYPELLADISVKPTEQHCKSIIDSSTPDAIKVLGLQYDPNKDVFKFKVHLPTRPQVTKRAILSQAGKLFDPLGWLAPITIKFKIFIQTLWILKLGWDDPLPQKEADDWKLMLKTLPSIERITVPRFVETTKKSTVCFHGFCDASQIAYGAVIYYHVTTETGLIYTRLMTAKTKVSPIKQESLPRLELCGALLLTKLMQSVQRETNTTMNQTFLWTDSTIVLDWLASHPRRWPTFVANRTAKILNSFSRAHWQHVPSLQNPADIASRGLLAKEMPDNNLWWNGPSWLHESQEFWPQQQNSYSHFKDVPDNFVHIAVTVPDMYENLISKYSSFHKLQRIIAYVLRFVAALRRLKLTKTEHYSALFLTREELFKALYSLCHYDQTKYYAQEVQDLKKKGSVNHTCTLRSLSPFIDEFGILRVGGRLENCEVPYSTRHPIILSGKSTLSKLIVEELHITNKHAGLSLLLALTRQQYWISGAKTLIRKVVHNCVTCTRHKAKCENQLMGNLPRFRLELVRPFIKVGVDFAGPLLIHLTKGRGQKTYKAYICLFICLSTKAVHIELVSDLSSDAFLAALKRFTARRGCSHEIYSDNGTNFVGANNQIQRSFETLIKNSNEISHYISRNAINWHFIPPSAPHFGGIWESAIKSTKFHLQRVLGETTLTMEEMMTVLTEIESILNSRPLCVLSADEIDALTPSHFLIGQPASKLPESDVSHLKPSHLSRWKMISYMIQHFWKRWQLEYITSLQQRSKWLKPVSSLNVNDIVTIKDENLPVNHWLLGKIIRLHPGSDGYTRVVTIKTKNGELKRPVTKIVRLPVEPDGSRPAVCL